MKKVTMDPCSVITRVFGIPPPLTNEISLNACGFCNFGVLLSETALPDFV